MKSLQAFRCCMRHGLVPRNVPFHLSNASKALRSPHGRRKPLATSRHLRQISTTSPKKQSRTATSPSPQSRPQPSRSSTAPPPSTWGSLTQGQRPHGTNPPLSNLDPAAISAMIEQRASMLEFVPKRAGLGSYDKTLTSKVSDGLARLNGQANHAALEGIHLRLSPMLGRTLAVEQGSGLDLQSAFRVLDTRCNQNNVKADSITQRTHIRRGQKRKLLKSKRWRARFKEGFIREVTRVRRMKAQGW